MSVLSEVVRHMWRAPAWMAPNERPKLTAGDGFVMSEDASERLFLSSHRVNGDGGEIPGTRRTASVEIDAFRQALCRYDRGRLVGLIAESVEYLTLLVFPRPLPVFRIRRDSRWGKTRA